MVVVAVVLVVVVGVVAVVVNSSKNLNRMFPVSAPVFNSTIFAVFSATEFNTPLSPMYLPALIFTYAPTTYASVGRGETRVVVEVVVATIGSSSPKTSSNLENV